jgi:hypothetical protein
MTFAELARRFKVSARTCEKWATYPDWPPRNGSGSFSVRRIDAFCKRNGLGPHNGNRSPAGRRQRSVLASARAHKIFEQSENVRIRNEWLRASQVSGLAGVVQRADVEELFATTRAIVARVQDETFAELEKVLAAPITAETYPTIRRRVIELVSGLNANMHAAMEKELVDG